MKKLLRQFHYSQRGFTLIELLIVVAILGIIAAVAVPNVGSFMTSGTLNAANTEAQNVKTAALAYYAEKTEWPETSASLSAYLTGMIKATYTFGDDGLISGATTTDWTGIKWDAASQTWIRI